MTIDLDVPETEILRILLQKVNTKLDQLPTTALTINVIAQPKNGKTPGVDRIPAEI